MLPPMAEFCGSPIARPMDPMGSSNGIKSTPPEDWHTGRIPKNGHNKLDETTFLGRRFGEFIAESNTCCLKTK